MIRLTGTSRFGNNVIRSLIVPLLAALLVACLLTVVITYYLSLRQLETHIHNIGSDQKSVVENMLWQFDTESLEYQLRGFVSLNDIKYAAVIDSTGKVFEAGEPTADRGVSEVLIPLQFTGPTGSIVDIGTLQLYPSIDGVWSLLRSRVLSLIIIYLATTVIVGLLILRQFSRNALAPVLGIAQALRHPPGDLSQLRIDLQRGSVGDEDEIDELVDAIHGLRDQVLTSREEMFQGEKRLAQSARLAGLGYSRFDASLERILDCDENYASFYRKSVEEMQSLHVGRDIVATMLRDEDVSHAVNTRKHILKTHRDSQTYKINYPDGKFRHIRHSFEGSFDEHGQLLAVDAVAQDITEEILKQELLLQSQKNEAIGKLTGGVAHDFNNILAVILGNIEILQDRNKDASLRQYADAALRAVSQGGKLTQQLLSFARKQPLSPQVIDVAKSIRSSAMLLQTSVGESIHLEIVSDGGLWKTRADPVQLEAVILNLVVNARDAMDQGGSLTLEISNARLDHEYARAHTEVVAGNYVCISVTDSGTGMSPEIVKQAIEPFFTSKPVGKGTGLGLSMAFGFAKQSGGHLKIYSEVGHGTTVKLYLPRVLAEVSMATPELVSEPHAILQGLHVFLIEDNEGLLQIFAEQIASLGCVVHCAHDEVSALALAEQVEHVDVILSDIIIPGTMDGRALSKRLQEIYPDSNVVYMSGFTENSVVHNGRLDDGIVFLQKPFRLIDLARVLAENA